MSSAAVDNPNVSSYEILNIIEIVYPNKMSIAPMSILNRSLIRTESKTMIMIEA
jgi:LEA14-like dessication related protein